MHWVNSGSGTLKECVLCGGWQEPGHSDSPPVERGGLSLNLGRLWDYCDQSIGEGCSARPIPKEDGSFSFLNLEILALGKDVPCKKSDDPEATKL